MTKLELLEYLTLLATKYRKDCSSSINRNNHMNDLKENVYVEQNVVDAILTDFINYIGVKEHVDYGLYTKDLRNER
jgi:hypothetical protein